jgi:3-oxoacyl-[acyl-carrier-protein] synthase II
MNFPIIGYLNAHGTGTAHNDDREVALISRIYPANTPIGATKGATGHALGATGAIECALCLLALYHQYLPPSPGLTDPIAPLAFIQQGHQANLGATVSHSFGFGGQNVIVGCQRYG